jgi:hypothetical protein
MIYFEVNLIGIKQRPGPAGTETPQALLSKKRNEFRRPQHAVVDMKVSM